MVIYLERGADLHMAQLMPLPLTVSCFSKIQIGFTSLVYRLTRVVPDTGPLNMCVSLVISVGPIILTSTGQIFAKFADFVEHCCKCMI